MSNILFTIGHSNRTLQEFIELLKYYGILSVCDVRSTPYSSKNPQFNREHLQEVLKQSGKYYVYLGRELGGRPDNSDCYTNGKADYKNISSMSFFKRGLERVRIGVEKNFMPALMCSEKDPISCHRAILICKHLQSENLLIKHVIDKQTVEEHKDLEQRLIDNLKIHPDFFDNNPSTMIERAYEIQAKRIAYTQDLQSAIHPESND
jgi:uncharacterized protein (DUF488 family)